MSFPCHESVEASIALSSPEMSRAVSPISLAIGREREAASDSRARERRSADHVRWRRENSESAACSSWPSGSSSCCGCEREHRRERGRG